MKSNEEPWKHLFRFSLAAVIRTVVFIFQTNNYLIDERRRISCKVTTDTWISSSLWAASFAFLMFCSYSEMTDWFGRRGPTDSDSGMND